LTEQPKQYKNMLVFVFIINLNAIELVFLQLAICMGFCY